MCSYNSSPKNYSTRWMLSKSSRSLPSSPGLSQCGRFRLLIQPEIAGRENTPPSHLGSAWPHYLIGAICTFIHTHPLHYTALKMFPILWTTLLAKARQPIKVVHKQAVEHLIPILLIISAKLSGSTQLSFSLKFVEKMILVLFWFCWKNPTKYLIRKWKCSIIFRLSCVETMHCVHLMLTGHTEILLLSLLLYLFLLIL